MLTISQFAAAVGCTLIHAERWHAPMDAAMVHFGIDTPVRAAAFLAQVGHESTNLTELEENLRYSAQRMLEVWPARFPGGVGQAAWYEYEPERLANRVYANRIGNGNEASGDGWRYRGRGPLQITGRANYSVCGAAIDKPLEGFPELVLDPRIGALVAGWVWDEHDCNGCAADVDEVSDRINLGRPTKKRGDANGFADRKARFERALKILGATA